MSAFYSAALARHGRATFTSGNPRIDSYFRQTVALDVKRGYAACYVLVEKSAARIAGFYTLSSHSIPLTALPHATARKLPRWPSIAAALIGWPGGDLQYQGQPIGAMLLADAITRLGNAPVASHAICADAIDDAAATFYRDHQFQPFISRANGFYLPLKTALDVMAMGAAPDTPALWFNARQNP